MWKKTIEELAKALGLTFGDMVFSNQVHDNKIRVVTEEDRGKGIYKTSDIIGFDGLATNKRKVALVTFLPTVCLFFCSIRLKP